MTRALSRSPKHPPRRGYMLIDLTLGLIIGTTLIISLAVAIGNLHRAQRRMADDRAAARRLEDSLLTLQSSALNDPAIQVERLPAAAGQRVPAGHVWVRLSLPAPGRGQRPPTLVGLIPDRPATGGTP